MERSVQEENIRPAAGGLFGRTIVVSAVLLSGVIQFIPLMPHPAALSISVMTVVLFAAAMVLRERTAVSVTLLVSLLAIWRMTVSAFFWPAILPPLACYFVLVGSIPTLRKSLTWLRRGSFNRAVLLRMGITVLLSGAALLAWFLIITPDLRHFLRSLPSWNPVLLPLEGIGFALLNAAMEESLFRGVLMEGLDEALGAARISVILQAVVFGLFHIRGIPGGAIGIVLASAYGLMLGDIRRRSQGIVAPFLTHIAADLVIFCMLAVSGPAR
ncbi:MAG: CPBP family intramembrane metalloprotease [Nitrospiraceae bacterium]|nr:CPBP family intramembrane metalloprotease [Nitrospiraceae bacterium]